MSDGREHVLRVWRLAEELAVQSSKPLHAFLLLHNILTQPPPQLRSSGVSIKSAIASSPTAAASAPLHVPSLDAAWKCEELATRLRAAEYLLFPDATHPVRNSPTEEASSSCVALPSFTTAAPPAHTLSRAAALESLELAEQVLAPVFAASSHTGASVGNSDINNHHTSAHRDGRGLHVAGTRTAPLDTVLSEVAQTVTTTTSSSSSNSACARSPSAAVQSDLSPAFFKSDVHSGGDAVNTRVTSMYFFNESTVAALAWPLTCFSLKWPFSTSSPVDAPPSLSFKAANQTIMIAVSLVVRAHVLQAVVCHRRVQYNRALQCLAEARKWVQQQFTASAQTRSLRLLWTDLQERWCSNASDSASVTAMPSPAPALSSQHLPHFDSVMKRLMELERRACEAMISVEECKVYFMILQMCGSLPPPPLLLHLPQSSSESSAATMAGVHQPSVHAPDLRLHYKRYQESVQKLHQVSRVYMSVLKWTEEEEEAGDTEEEVQKQRMRRTRREGSSGKGEGDDEVEEGEGISRWREHVRRVQCQLSPFCLCALQHIGPSTPSSQVLKHSTEVPDQHGHAVRLKTERSTNGDPLPQQQKQQQRCTRADSWRHTSYVVNYDKRLAAEVLGLYHCVSFFYVLYQHASTTTPATNDSVGQHLRGIEKAEAEFFAGYSGVTAAAPPAAPSPLSPDVWRDAVQRALTHVRIYAFVFGGLPFRSSGDDAAGRWRSDSARAESSAFSSPAAVHEAALLLCLAEMALTDNFPFAVRFCSALNGARSSAASSAAKKEEDEGEVGGDGVRNELPQAQWGCPSAAAALGAVTAAPHKLDGPLLRSPPSWHWVLPGVRVTLQLYLELTTVLMQAAATMQASVPPPSPVIPAARAAAAAGAIPPVPILQVGLQRAEQLHARLLFNVDREMLQLTGNAWNLAAAPLSSAHTAAVNAMAQVGVSAPQQQRQRQAQSSVPHDEGDGPSSASMTPLSPCTPVDHLQSSSPAQLRWLVQIKAAALLTMARHHLTQLSIVRAVHYLREMKQFMQVFHRQAKLLLLPEMHVLLATVATCMSLRRLPDHRVLPQGQQKQLGCCRGLKRSRGGEALLSEGEDGDDHHGAGIDHDNDEGAPGSQPSDAGDSVFVGEALYAFAQGWPLAGSASLSSSAPALQTRLTGVVEGDGSPPPSAFLISPREEATVAQDVGLPYLHLLAAERAACTSLYTPPSFMLLLYLMKAWLVYQLVAAGEELTWAEPMEVAADTQRTHERQQQHSPKVPASPPSPACSPLPLPTASYATTTLNTTVEDQQRRIARLDSLTSTSTSAPTTPALRSRHATLPAEMQRIQLDPSALPSPVVSFAKPAGSAAAAAPAKVPEKFTAMQPSSPAASLHAPRAAPTASAAPARFSPPAHPLPPPSLPSLYRSPYRRPCAQAYPTAQATPVPLTVRHRAGDVLQRMMAVLRHHYEVYSMHASSSLREALSCSTSAPTTVPVTAWTPQNVTLFRLLRGAVLLTEDRDEPASARELKEATHYAKQHLGVLHPYVADGLALLTSAYTSLDVDAVSYAGISLSGGAGARPSASPSCPQDGAARTRRVAVQLAMRCSCTALASLAVSDNTPVPFSPTKLPATSSSGGLEGSAAAATVNAGDSSSCSSSSSHNNIGGASDLPYQQQQTVMFSRLHEWWNTQVLEELCGNRSVHRSTHAVKQLRALFGWLTANNA
ncbi:hypothetical protein ABL78_1736 [Leptomonas seymouri]|uniref:Uncharacterized protein n=1 Tax=Leptomonas seymouri TaxID=5684 RepID=A0A0N1I8H9_LEPSE|nr:hypothetical protein ABL78_1736 [Leptomonas seymouri]|eukprot:KPI89173.1 hypothetical protein ABL78_1736 [Leptomonas seymouri]